MLFDLLLQCQPLREDVAAGTVGFGINLTMRDFANNKKKNLDLVICTPGTRSASGRVLGGFRAMATKHDIALEPTEQIALAELPDCQEVPVGEVLIALEAKATMTAHQRALPRLFDELNSSHNIVHGHATTTIAAGLVIVNIAEEFISSDKNRFDLKSHPRQVSRHKQPRDAALVVRTASDLPKRSDTSGKGFDALGIIVLNCRNDGTRVSTHTTEPAPQPGASHHYDECIRRICSLYRSRFPLI